MSDPSIVAARRAQAAAWRALADATDAEADALERADSPDDLLTLGAAALATGKTERAIRDNGIDRGGSLEIVTVGRSPRVRRSALLAWAQPLAPRPAEADPRASARAAVAGAATRAGAR